jgi:hypothetical protein
MGRPLAVLWLLAAVTALQGEADDGRRHTSLLQGDSFLSKMSFGKGLAGLRASHAVAPGFLDLFFGITLPPCPGDHFRDTTEPGTCSRRGVRPTYRQAGDGGKDVLLADFLGDNVLLDHLELYVNDKLYEPADFGTHPFPAADTPVTVKVYDVAGNMEECVRKILIRDNEMPIFDREKVGPGLVEKWPEGFLERPLDGDCSIPVAKVFQMYEEESTWQPNGTDNCNSAHLDYQVTGPSGDFVYDSIGGRAGPSPPLMPKLRGPGEYVFTYLLSDMHGNPPATHSFKFTAADGSPPINITGCPATQHVVLGAHEDAREVWWDVPVVSADNCMKFGTIPQAHEQSLPKPRRPGDSFGPGSHPVSYMLQDAAGNPHAFECNFTIEVTQEAHEVDIVCPSDVVVRTLPDASFALPTWPAPNATQGGKTLDASHITYHNGVEPGMAFPYGVTTVTVHAKGKVGNNRIDEHLKFAECSFSVTVLDPQVPEVDGRLYRCAEVKEESAVAVAPFEICDGPALTYQFHEGYPTTGAYSILSRIDLHEKPCCTSEHDMKHQCVLVPGSTKVSYCAPSDSDALAEAYYEMPGHEHVWAKGGEVVPDEYHHHWVHPTDAP